MNKKIVISILVLIVIAALGFLWYSQQPKVKAYEFAGRVEKVEGNVIYTRGVFQNVQNPKGQELSEAGMQIVVDDKTTLKKIIQYLPNAEELKKTGGLYRPEELRKEESVGSMDDLTNGLTDGVFAKSDRNIFGKTKFVATEITYYVRVSSE